MSDAPRPTSGLMIAGVIALFVVGAGGLVALTVLYNSWATSGGPVAPRSPAPAPLVIYADVTEQSAGVPARFAAPFPALERFAPEDALEFWTDAHPPLAHVQDLLCQGDDAMHRRWLVQVRAASARGAPPEQISEGYRQLFTSCEDPVGCAPLRALTDEPDAILREAAVGALAECGSPADADFFL